MPDYYNPINHLHQLMNYKLGYIIKRGRVGKNISLLLVGRLHQSKNKSSMHCTEPLHSPFQCRFPSPDLRATKQYHYYKLPNSHWILPASLQS
jgi:hypothetical protein